MMRTSRTDHRPASGFTLLELLLVLAILVVATAIAVPAVVGPMEGQRLMKAADQVRSAFNRARVAAMRTGQVQFFRFQPNTNLYAIEALNDGEGYLEASADIAFSQSPMMAGPQGGLAPSEVLADEGAIDPLTGAAKPLELPENMIFVQSSNLNDLRSARILEQMQTSGDITLSPPILFYPDGTSTTSQVILSNQEEIFVIVRLRGLTGLATVTDLLTREELPQTQ